MLYADEAVSLSSANCRVLDNCLFHVTTYNTVCLQWITLVPLA